MAANLIKQLKRNQRGSAVVEFAIFAPMLLTMLAGMAKFGMGYFVRNHMQDIARAPSLKRTRIIFGENIQAMHCFLSDVSDFGARVRPAAADRVPDRFEMQLEHDEFVDCTVVYRDSDALGVAFLQREMAGGATPGAVVTALHS